MTALVIANTQIRCDAAGRYCLNDLHQASGGEGRHQPAKWLRLQSTQELANEVVSMGGNSPEMASTPVTTSEGFGGGTYAVKELVYAYAMWISAAFHLHVIRAYDALVRQDTAPPATSSQLRAAAWRMEGATRILPASLRVARHLYPTFPEAAQAAARCSLRRTGVDWCKELGVRPDDRSALPAWNAGNSMPGIARMPGLPSSECTRNARRPSSLPGGRGKDSRETSGGRV